MAAFVVFIRDKTKDQSEMDTYTAKAGPSLNGQAVSIHAAYGRHEVLEGPDIGGCRHRLLPTFEEAKAVHHLFFASKSSSSSLPVHPRFPSPAAATFFVTGLQKQSAVIPRS